MNPESVVLVHRVIAKTPELVKSTSLIDVEVHITKMFIIVEAPAVLPIQFDDVNRSLKEVMEGAAAVSLAKKLEHRTIDLRTLSNQAIFNISAGICKLFRGYLDKRTSFKRRSLVLLPAKAAVMFSKFNNFNKDAYLAQSPQLHKQMLMCGDFWRIYEAGPAFRAENSQTPRHMTGVGAPCLLSSSSLLTEILGMISK